MNFDTINWNEVDDEDSFEPLPAGDYEVMVKSVDEKPTKDNTGVYLHFAYQVVSGKYANRVIFDNVNVKNNNVQAVTIGRKRLKTILKATGLLGRAHATSNDLIGRRVMLNISIQEDPGYGKQNVVKHISPVAGMTNAPTAPIDAQPQNAVPNNAPWAHVNQQPAQPQPQPQYQTQAPAQPQYQQQVPPAQPVQPQPSYKPEWMK